MKIEMITQTGAFGFLFIGTCFGLIYLGYLYYKREGIFKTLIPFIPIIIGVFLFTTLASELIKGVSYGYKPALFFIKETLPFLIPSLASLYYIMDSGSFDNLHTHKKPKAKQK